MSLKKAEKRYLIQCDDEEEILHEKKRRLRLEDVMSLEENKNIEEDSDGDEIKFEESEEDDESEEDESEEDESEKYESEKDESEEDESEKDESEKDESEEDESITEDDEEDLSALPKYFFDKIEHFTPEQRYVFNYVHNLLTDKYFRRENKTAIFVRGPMGSGKTELLKVLCDYTQHSLGQHAIFTASSGVAAMRHREGRTAHSMFGFPINMDSVTPKSYWKISVWNKNQVLRASLIVYDEVNMTDARLIHMLDRSLKKLMRSDKIFGGKIIIFGGDFLQVAPIANDVASPIFSPLWPELKTFSLTAAQRIKTDPDFMDFLIDMGSDNLPTYPIKSLTFDIQKALPLPKIACTTKIKDLLEFVFPKQILEKPDECARRAILTPNLSESVLINKIIFNRLKGMASTETSYDTLDWFTDDFGINVREDIVYPQRDITLKKGCLCMVVRNMYTPITLLTGARVIVEAVRNGEIVVRKPGKRVQYSIKRETFHVRIDGEWIRREQYPLRLAYAMPVHKSQGQTLDKVGLDLREPLFRHGQLYLALGRVRNRKDIKVLANKDHIIKNVAHVPHVVCEDLVKNDIKT